MTDNRHRSGEGDAALNLPSGTVTFLFTDIEGSTRLWETYPEAMRRALARHDALLRRTIEENRGLVFKTLGDAFCAVFATASDALAAALAAQIALQQEGRSREPGADTSEPLSGLTAASSPLPPLKVRMALHTGACELRDNDYFGPPLNRVARLLAVGHGEQTLLSRTVYDLLCDNLPPDVSLSDLGEHRLRDLQRPEQVFQLQFPDLTSAFPPLKSLNNPLLPNNLPRQMTSFIGREREIAEIKALLGTTRLLTLTGAGGCGKTRLALQVAAEMLDGTGDGVWFIELAPLAEPGLVPQVTADVLGVVEQPGTPLMQTLASHLKPKNMLLILDNCEHLLAACARLTETLLRSCPQLRILVSSREPLGLTGEQTYPVPSLSLPQKTHRATPESLAQFEAVRLFVERAVAAQSSFAVTSRNAPALAQLCVRLDGIPFAIELAAARMRSLSLEETNSRLDNRFRLLTGGHRTALPRQQTLRALIDWSYDLLNEQEKMLLGRLAVFSGGWTLEAAETVCGGDGIEEWEGLDLLVSLVDKSLVIAEMGSNSTRYRLLETMREYARDRLAERGEGEAIQARHRDFYLQLTEQAEPELKGAEQTVWLERLMAEHDNLRVALDWRANDEKALRIVGALWRFWHVCSYAREGMERLTRTLKQTEDLGRTSARARALNGAGNLAMDIGDFSAAQALYAESLAIRREIDDRPGIAYSLGNLGNIAMELGDYKTARALQEESLAIQRALGNRWGIANTLGNLASITHYLGDYAATRALQEESLVIRKELGDRRGIALSLCTLGNVAASLNDHAAARGPYEESLTLFQELGDRRNVAYALSSLGNNAAAQGDIAKACALHTESIKICQELGDKQGLSYALSSLAIANFYLGDYAAARDLCEASLKLFQEMGDRRGAAYALSSLGNNAVIERDGAKARAFYTESLKICRELGDRKGIASALEGYAGLACLNEQAERAALLWGAAETLREAIDASLWAPEQAEHDRQVEAVRTLAGGPALEADLARGRALTLDQAIACALEEAAS